MRALGYVLVALPVVFTLFPAAGRIHLALRVAVGAAWIAGLWLLQREKEERDQQIAALVEEPLDRQDMQREVAAQMILPRLLQNAGFPEVYEFRLFLLDADTQRLVPSYEPDHEPSTGWRPGQGVTGKAWETREYECARGDELRDPGYGLDEEQLKRYAHLQVVAAMPVRSARNDVIAILTGSSSEADDFLTSPDGKDRHQVLADVVGRVLIDILRLTHD